FALAVASIGALCHEPSAWRKGPPRQEAHGVLVFRILDNGETADIVNLHARATIMRGSHAASRFPNWHQRRAGVSPVQRLRQGQPFVGFTNAVRPKACLTLAAPSRWVFALAFLLFLSESVVSQDRLKAMPGYERYKKVSQEMTNAVPLGILSVTWTNGGK